MLNWQLSPGVVRILGQNPGPFTLQGTNTYLLGSVLIDTAEGGDEYIALLRKALSNTTLTDIILTHWHGDHVNGLPEVLKLCSRPPRIHKWPSDEHDEDVLEKLQSVLPDAQIHELAEGQRLDLGDGRSVAILHAPGHTTDSIAIRLSTGELLTADTVLGEGTAVFENLSTYLATLSKLRDSLGSGDEVKLLPGHGPVVERGKERLEMYMRHRLEREQQVAEALRKGSCDLEELVERVYGPELADKLKPAAARGLLLHLNKLEDEDRVEEKDTKWSLVNAKL